MTPQAGHRVNTGNVLNTSLQSFTTNDNVASVYNESQTAADNTSFTPGCRKVVLSEMEFIPWDNPSNIVSAEVESVTYRMKDIVLVLLFLIGGPGNVINMAVFYKQGLKDRVNLCLFALSLADELYLIAAMFHHGEQMYLQFTTEDRFGPMYTFLVNNNFTGFLGFLYVSLILSAIIASERCLCVLSPLKFHTLMRARTTAVIIVAMYISVVGLYVIVSFRLYIGCIYDPTTGAAMKTVVFGEFYKAHKQLVDYLDSVVFGAGLPGVVMIMVMTTTIITTMRLRQIVTWRAGATINISAREIALTKMLIGTSILFIFCVFPFAVTRVSWLIFPEMNSGQRNQNFYLTTFWINKILTYINSSFNIFVYYAMGSRYRETFFELFTRKHKARKSQDVFHNVSSSRE